MTQNWQEIWKRRGATGEPPYDLRSLMDLDGFDCGPGRVAADDMRRYARTIAPRPDSAAADFLDQVAAKPSHRQLDRAS
jgi:hypothetical protein